MEEKERIELQEKIEESRYRRKKEMSLIYFWMVTFFFCMGTLVVMTFMKF